MSAQSLGDESSLEASDSQDEGQGRAKLTTKPKRNRFCALTFRSDIETDLLSAEGVSMGEKTKIL